jgi:protein-disulfide isomerase
VDGASGWRRKFFPPEFEQYAGQFGPGDGGFSASTPLTDEVRKQNYGLAERFQVEGFPTIVIQRGREMVGHLGYMPGTRRFYWRAQELPKS